MAKNTSTYHQLIILLLLTFMSMSVFSKEQIWLKDVETGFKKAKEEKKPIVVFVTATWCSYCTIMKNTTLTNPMVSSLIESYIRIEVDFDLNSEFCNKWKINQLPVTMIFNQFGELVSRENGAMKQMDFIRWFSKNDFHAKSDVSKNKAKEDQTNLLFHTFNNNKPEIKNQTFVLLENSYCEEKEKNIKDYIALKMQEIIQSHPTYLGNLMNSSKLELRILSANMLKNLNLEIDYDPWEPYPERTEKAKSFLSQIDKIIEKIKPTPKK